ncbi:MAG: hypothetical protein IBX64_08095 [Actinobacteria bacterium]|nr:hypothetical protein [Actinomycetota bacterium]
MRKVTMFFVAVLLVAGVSIAYVYLISDNAKDNRIWRTIIKNELSTKSIKQA